jgi:RNA 2',3'-cyclic 3'-phosphodiesterase
VRLFVAITPPAAVLDELEARVSALRPAWPALRWTGQAAWHVTLAFLGEVGDEAAAALGPRLERAAHRHPSLDLCIAGAGAFPGPRRARVLWAGISGDRQALEALARSVAAGARRAGAPPPDQSWRFRAHLTLARCREPADVGELVAALAGYAGAPWTVAEIHLMCSRPGDPGSPPRYETVGTWPLRLRPAARHLQDRAPVAPDGPARPLA